MRAVPLILLTLFFLACKQKAPPVPEEGTPQGPANAPIGANPLLPGDSFPPMNKPDVFFPGFALVLFGNSILVDTNGWLYSLKGQARMYSPDLAVAEVDTESLHREWLDLLGKSFTLHTPDGEGRKVVLQGFVVVSIASDNAEVFRTFWDAHPDRKLTLEEFRDLEAAHLLVGVFDPFDTTMLAPDLPFLRNQPVWARLSTLPGPRRSEAFPPDTLASPAITQLFQGSSEYKSLQTAYEAYTRSHSSAEEDFEVFPTAWKDYAKRHRSRFRLNSQEIEFVSWKSRDNCGSPGFRGEQNVLLGPKPFRFASLSDLPATDVGHHRLIYAWDNESAGNVDLLFSDGFEHITFLRLAPDGTTRHFFLKIPNHGPNC